MTILKLLAPVLVLGGLAVLSPLEADPNTSSRVAAEIERVQRAWTEISQHATREMEGVGSSIQASLKDASDALKSGRIYLALERLTRAEDLLRGVQEVIEKTDTVKGGQADFETEWGKANVEVANLSRPVREKKWSGSPAAVRALAEVSLGRTIALLDGGRGFAAATGPKDGLLYIGEAKGQAEFAGFCASLQAPRKGGERPVRSLLPELLALQAKADAAFQPPRSIEQHARFIALNSAIKFARELDSSGSYYGALYEYLEAVRHYAMLDAEPVAASGQAALKAWVESERQRAANAPHDDSILELFLERAGAQVSHSDGSAPTPDEWRSSAVISEQVVAAYHATQNPAQPLEKAEGKRIDVTLVRWPYT